MRKKVPGKALACRRPKSEVLILYTDRQRLPPLIQVGNGCIAPVTDLEGRRRLAFGSGGPQ